MFKFDGVPFVIFAFVAIVFGVTFKKIPLRPMSRNLPPTFTSTSLMVSGLPVKSLIYLELIWNGIRK